MGVGGEVAPDTNKIFMEETNMKKIIATVLAMVMALALCTTAFAADKTAFGDAKSGVPTYDSAYSYEIKAAAPAYEKNVGTFQVLKTDVEAKTVTSEGVFVKVADVEQASKILVVGNTITYLADSSFGTKYDAKAVEVKTVDTAKNCGEVSLGKGVDALYSLDGKYYVASPSGSKVLLVGDTLLKVAEASENDYTEVPHKWNATATTKDGKTTITALTCDTCKKSFEFKTSATDAVKAFGADGYTVETVKVNDVDYTLYVKNVATATTPAGNTTTSPKTFDAGIAMYVGMALTSVAGSAVVIGKKKEF